eukprot:TRINITY_DN5408_c0_g1_i12.p1 TRINITY_DN5408_c0_g1~~TRINITY_DN5408_c0_g1_i12.p1  ORF type:complete len:391 (-),score=87.85 TRINITY_DN5408_c0_g1_i12:144-1316(-)
MKQKLRKFLLSTDYYDETERSLKETLSQALDLVIRRERSSVLLNPIVDSSLIDKVKSLCALDFSSEELATQLTLIDYQLLCRVPLEELLNLNFQKAERSPNLSAMAKRFDLVNMWVATEILTVHSRKKCTKMISHFISVAKRLLALNNFHGFISVFLAMTQCVCYNSLATKEAWNKLPPKDIQIFERLTKIASPNLNFKCLREILANNPPPRIQTPMLFLKDLTFIDEVNPNFLSVGFTGSGSTRGATSSRTGVGAGSGLGGCGRTGGGVGVGGVCGVGGGVEGSGSGTDGGCVGGATGGGSDGGRISARGNVNGDCGGMVNSYNGNESNREKAINCEKMSLVGNLLASIRKDQQRPYHIEPTPITRTFLLQLVPMDRNSLEIMSNTPIH